MTHPGDITRLLSAARGGDDDALSEVFPLVYDELRRIAHRQLGRRGPSTLNTTAVVHDAYLKLAGPAEIDVRDRGHFFALASTAMRQILVDHARKHLAQKRGGGVRHDLLDENEVRVEASAGALLDLDRALQQLSELDPRAGKIVELRFFGGLTVEETASALDITDRTVKRDWRKARAFLYQELEGGAEA